MGINRLTAVAIWTEMVEGSLLDAVKLPHKLGGAASQALQANVDYFLSEIARLTAERDAAFAAGVEAAAKRIQSESGTEEEADYKAYLADEIRALSPASAQG